MLTFSDSCNRHVFVDIDLGKLLYFFISGKVPTQVLVFQPQRDGALENDIVVHEMTHGVTNRMTGGGTGRCLQGTEAGGMGEGWSDAMAE